MLSPGVVLNGRYRLSQRIAAGGMGEVWRGDDLLLHRAVAVKVLLPALMSDADFITRFRSEARMMAALRHPGIVQVYDYGENAQVGEHQLDYLVMEYIDGTPLSKRIQQAGRLGPAETMTIVAQVADALQAAHDAGIIHRDVKPSNLLVRPAGAIVLVDFGVARSAGITGITSTNVVLGSAHYMAPEQAEGRPVTAVTDVYALGAVAFSCLAGRPPYVGDNPLAVLAQLVHGQPPVLPADVPAAAASVVLRALAKNPGQRFTSASDLAAAAREASQPAGYAVSPPHPRQSGPLAPGPLAPVPLAPGPLAPGPLAAVSGSAPPVVAASGPALPAAAASKKRRNATVVLAAAAVVALLTGIAVILGNTDDPGTGPQAAGPPVDRLQADPVQSTEPRGQVSTRPGGKKPSPRAASSAPSTSPAAGAPATSSSATAQPTGTTVTDPASSSGPPPTATATNPGNDPATICGTGYKVINSHPLTTAAGVLRGTIYVLYRTSGEMNCVVTIKADTLDDQTTMSATLRVQGDGKSYADKGTFEYYAGPVSAAAPKSCIKWGGAIGSMAYESGWSHCT